MAEENKDTIIEEHKKMIMMTGNLSDFQLQNLKTWPFLLFDDLDNVEINYDFTKLIAKDEETLSPGSVQFNFKFKEGTKLNKEKTKQSLNILTTWTRFLFWKETEVKFANKGKLWKL